MFMAEKSPLRCYKQRYSLSLEKETPSLTTAAAAAASSSRIWGSDADADSGDDEDAFRDRLEFVFCQRASELSRDQSVAASPSSGCHRSENNEQHRRLYNYLHGVGVFTTNTTASLTNVLYGANVSGASESADDVAAGNGDVGSAGCDPVDGFIEAARSHGQQSALTGAVAEYVSATGASMLDWKDLMVAKVTLLVHSNVYLTSLVGCVHQSTLLMCDRLQGLAAFYLHKLQGDDPERIHLEQLRDAPDWQHLLLRCSMASLTWKQRQMLELTRDGGLLNSEELREMMRRQVEEYDRARVIKIASEYFYFSNDGNSAGGCNNAMRGGIGSSDALPAEDCAADRLLREEVAPGDDDADGSPGVCSSRALISNIHAWLVSEADSGDEDAQYFLARFFSAPAFREDAQCSVCRAVFGITLFRHHCRFCGNSVCHQHSLQRRCIFRSVFSLGWSQKEFRYACDSDHQQLSLFLIRVIIYPLATGTEWYSLCVFATAAARPSTKRSDAICCSGEICEWNRF